MSDKIIIDIWKKKNPEEITKELANPDSRLEIGSAAAITAACAAAFAGRAASFCEKSERSEYLKRNIEIIRGYMVHLIDEDVKSRGPLRQALKEGEAYKIEAARETAVCIPAEIVNMVSQLMDFLVELAEICPAEKLHHLGEAAQLAMACAESCRIYIINMAEQSHDDTYRFVTRRENEITFEILRENFENILKKVGNGLDRSADRKL